MRTEKELIQELQKVQKELLSLVRKGKTMNFRFHELRGQEQALRFALNVKPEED